MVLEKFEKKHYDDYIAMSLDFFSSEAVAESIPLENFHNTFNQVINNSQLCDGYIFVHEEKICGYVQISFSWNNDFGGKVLWVEELFIKPNYRSMNLGKQAMEDLVTMFKPTVKAFRLEVNNGCRALNLYERLGYTSRVYNQYYKEV